MITNVLPPFYGSQCSIYRCRLTNGDFSPLYGCISETVLFKTLILFLYNTSMKSLCDLSNKPPVIVTDLE